MLPALAKRPLPFESDETRGIWTPAWTGLTVVGAPTYTGYYTRIGRLALLSVQIVAGGAITTASTYGVSFINNLPFIVANIGSRFTGTVLDATNGVNLGLGYASAASTNFFAPTWAATNATLMLNVWYFI